LRSGSCLPHHRYLNGLTAVLLSDHLVRDKGGVGLEMGALLILTAQC
jgi:hypothetical protein